MVISTNEPGRVEMKVFMMCFSISFFCVAAYADGPQQTGNVINVNVGKGCCAATPCKQKTKVVTKTVTVEKEVKVPVIVEVEKPYPVYHEVEKRVVVEKRVQKKNHISLLGGMGPTRIDQPQNNRVDLIRGPVGGLMYQRNVSESWELGVQGQTNQTALGVLTYGF
jgi:hypothetical protein